MSSRPQPILDQGLLFVVSGAKEEDGFEGYLLLPRKIDEYDGLDISYPRNRIQVFGQKFEVSPSLDAALRLGTAKIVELQICKSYHYNEGVLAARCCIFVEKFNHNIIKSLFEDIPYFLKQDVSDINANQAVYDRNAYILDRLLSNGANIALSHPDGGVLIHLAALRGNMILLKLLLKHNANLEAVKHDGSTALSVAVRNGRVPFIAELLRHGANVNVSLNSGDSGCNRILPLHEAVKKSCNESVQMLLDYGAPIDAPCSLGKTPLLLSVETRNTLMVKLVLEHHPSRENKSNQEAFRCSVRQHGGQAGERLGLLMLYGFTVCPENANEPEMLEGAIRHRKFKLVEALLSYGVDVNQSLIDPCMPGFVTTALHIAAKHASGDVVQLLIDSGADTTAIRVDSAYSKGMTPLFDAVRHSNLEAVKVLIEHTANVQDEPELLHTAVLLGSFEIAEVLLERGCDVNGETCELFVGGKYYNAGTPLLCAARKGCFKIVEVLLKCGAQVNYRDASGRTALHEAAEKNFPEVVNLLIQNGADIDAQCEKGETPLFIAVKKNYAEVAQILLTFDADLCLKTKYDRRVFDEVIGHAHIGTKDYKNNYDATAEKLFCFVFSDPKLAQKIKILKLIKEKKIKGKCSDLVQSIEEAYRFATGISKPTRGIKSKVFEEYKQLRKENVGDTDISFRDILIGKRNKLVHFARNDSVKNVFRKDDLAKSFPYYHKLLSSKFLKGSIRRELLEKGKKAFSSLTNQLPNLPDEIQERILFHLSNRDILIFFGACAKDSAKFYSADRDNP